MSRSPTPTSKSDYATQAHMLAVRTDDGSAHAVFVLNRFVIEAEAIVSGDRASAPNGVTEHFLHHVGGRVLGLFGCDVFA
ncbi:hypothetical protein [Rhodococcus globerulus]|uniref:hypothetical protein n=1 Tax=Rhodococcus globerulus TaxID=33008 RepID=UPI001F3F4BD4|nr:hypothetical protein [Rhodococcus globerulus]MCE4267260.1 hypothetical protein [Rhodococcus globerulus]